MLTKAETLEALTRAHRRVHTPGGHDFLRALIMALKEQTGHMHGPLHSSWTAVLGGQKTVDALEYYGVVRCDP